MTRDLDEVLTKIRLLVGLVLEDALPWPSQHQDFVAVVCLGTKTNRRAAEERCGPRVTVAIVLLHLVEILYRPLIDERLDDKAPPAELETEEPAFHVSRMVNVLSHWEAQEESGQGIVSSARKG